MLKNLKRHLGWVLSGVSGVLLFMSFPPFGFWFLSYIALIPVLIAISKSEKRRAFYLGLFFGFVYFVGLINWVIVLAPFANLFLVILALVALSGYLCLYMGLFVLILKLLVQKPNIFYPFIVANIWTALEFIRGWFFTGFPWGSLGYSQVKNLPLIQLASLFGVFGISYLVALTNATIAYIFIFWKKKMSAATIISAIFVPFCLLTCGMLYGIIALSHSSYGQVSQNQKVQKVKIAMVPGNIKQKEKWKSENIQDNFLRYLTATQKAAIQQPTMVIWPETAVPVDLISRNSYIQILRDLASRYNVYLLIGIPHVEGYFEGVKTYNSVFLLSPKGEILDMYHKIHLVPFGEYIPFKRYLPKKLVDLIIGVGDFDPGSRHTLFSVASLKFGVGICFESCFPDIFRKFAQNGSNFMGIVTNDAWFEGTAAPRQHYDMAAFRAIENRTDIFRVANGGISAVIDAYGRTKSEEINAENPKEEFLIAEVSINSKRTIYTKYGDLLLCLIITATTLVLMMKKRRGKI